MKLSTKATYGTRAIFDIAVNSAKGPVSIKDISKRQDISVAYLEQLLNKLKKKGFLKSTRGPKGGYMLAKNPKDIRMGDVVRTLEGSVYPVDCVDGSDSGCSRVEDCAMRILWKRLADSMKKVLDSTTLKDLKAEAERKAKVEGKDYPEYEVHI
ncbi:MAG: hypothetical protein AUJ75_01505 [Candidatus Omnitrophica bacterium CG1_02_49_10]|nr:MAG: hypothetical protein AUJ75_01505 [Candidatus Omnitrophica bacterium CG1_02_49_10]